MDSSHIEETGSIEPEEASKAPKSSTGAEMKRWIKAFIAAFLVFLLLRIFVFDINRVRGTSMEPTLHPGEKVIIDKLSYRFDFPHAGEITVFRKPGTDKKLIKRIIGCPGDTLYGENGILYVNGSRVSGQGLFFEFTSLCVEDGHIVIDNRNVYSPDAHGIVYADNTSETGRIPDGTYFVLGDNYSESLDSRELGFIPRENIVGKLFVTFRLFPPLFRKF